MAIFRWRQNWMPFQDLEQEVDRLLESIRLPFPGFRIERQFPPCNLYELPGEYLLLSEISGIVSSEIELSISQGVLKLKGNRLDPANVADDRYRRRERIAGSWERSFALPDRILEEHVSAEYTDGILKVHLPKPPAGVPRQIPVLGVSSHIPAESSQAETPQRKGLLVEQNLKAIPAPEKPEGGGE